jgi:pimeloyl-ACP methyl ester carboxylesterase
MQDYGGPVGFRMALADPERVEALIVQNAVAHNEGLGELWKARRAFWADRAAHEDTLRANLLSLTATRTRHLGSDPEIERYDRDLWTDEFVFLSQPGQGDIQSDLFYDYRTNVDAYPKWQDWMRRNQPRLLVIWGKYDPSFDISEPEAYRRDVPKRRCISSMPVTSHWTRLRTRSRHWSEIFSAHLAEVAFERTTILLWASSWSTDIAGRSDRVRLRQQGTSVESASADISSPRQRTMSGPS